MFSKISRYRKLPEVVTTDIQQRTVESKSLRLLPEVSGTFLHKIEAGDRLDHLAQKYYRQPRKWWRICDANPQFLSPLALLGQEPIVTARFPVVFTGSSEQPRWDELHRQLLQEFGVLDLHVVEEVRPVREVQTIDGERHPVYVDHYERAVIVTYNQLNVDAGRLAAIITAADFDVRRPEVMGQTGQNIVIPPDGVG